MTTENPPHFDMYGVVKSIEQRLDAIGRDSRQTLDAVESIDNNVEEIVDRLNEQLDELRYRQDWRGPAYDHEPY